METKFEGNHKFETFVPCSFCGKFKNSANVYHRKSAEHQKNIGRKLNRIAHHLSLKKCAHFVVHDEQWSGKDCKRFCHFCCDTFPEHHAEDELIIEPLGSLLHHAAPQHIEHVKTFLKQNGRKDNIEKFCVSKTQLDSIFAKVSEVKLRYLRKLELLNVMDVRQIREAEEARMKLVKETIQESSFLSYATSTGQNTQETPKQNFSKGVQAVKVPPWLSDDLPNTSTSGNRSSDAVIGPTMDSYLKHIEKEKKKTLPVKRLKTNFKLNARRSSKWLPSFHGVWNQGRRRQLY